MPDKDCSKSLINGIKKDENFLFSKHTTYGLGGRAKVAYYPKTEQEAAALFDYLKESGEKFVVLGNGSNVLVADGYFDGAVICTKNLCGINLEEDGINCLSGTTVSQLLKFCIDNNLGGYEYLAGIPATIGGLALMNGGIAARHIGDDILSVKVYDGNYYEFSNEICNFGNKHSIMRDISAMIISIKLSKFAVPREIFQKNINVFLKKRKHLPKGKSCGCAFKNPEGLSAGKLIDNAGLKGLKCGGAEVSFEHANFILNKGGSAADVYKLIQQVKQRVFDYCGIELVEEVIYIGEFNDFDS